MTLLKANQKYNICLVAVFAAATVALCLFNIGTFKISPVYFVFLAIILMLYLFARERKTACFISVLSLFFVFFICSENGSDYANYGGIFDMVKTGVDFGSIHGETLYLLINKFFSSFLSYNAFRVVFLGAFTFLYAYSAYKLSPDPTYSFILTFLGLIVYLISAYRQFAVCAIALYSVWLALGRRKKFLPAALCAVSVFIHGSGIISLAIVICLCLKFNCKIKHGYVLLSAALAARAMLYVLFKTFPVESLVSSVTVYTELKLFSFGFLSRIAECLLLWIYSRRVNLNPATQKLFFIYFWLTLLYIAVPYEFLMARLLIICRFFAAILVPAISLSEQTTKSGLFLTKSYAVKNELRSLFFIIYLVLFIYQLGFQSGYFPYIHMFF